MTTNLGSKNKVYSKMRNTKKRMGLFGIKG